MKDDLTTQGGARMKKFKSVQISQHHENYESTPCGRSQSRRRKVKLKNAENQRSKKWVDRLNESIVRFSERRIFERVQMSLLISTGSS